ncbi:MAG: hypothetical protein ACON4H_01465 [Rubripirellula sp.]
MDYKAAKQPKRKAMMRVQMQALILLSLVLVLLLLSFGESSESPSARTPRSQVESIHAMRGQLPPDIPVDDASTTAKNRSSIRSRDRLANVENDISGRDDQQVGEGGEAKRDKPAPKLPVEKQASRSLSNLAANPNQKNSDDESQSVLTRETQLDASVLDDPKAAKLPLRKVDEHLFELQERDLNGDWGGTLAQRIHRSSLPMSELAQAIMGNGEFQSPRAREDRDLLDTLPNDDSVLSEALNHTSADRSTWMDSDTTYPSVPTILISQSHSAVGDTLRQIGFIEAALESTAEDQPSGQTPLASTNLANDEYEAVVQPAIGLIDETAGFGESKPSADIAMTQLQSPVPGTTGPLAPAAPIGPGAGPTVNFPSTPNQSSTAGTPSGTAGASGSAGNATAAPSNAASQAAPSNSNTSNSSTNRSSEPDSNSGEGESDSSDSSAADSESAKDSEKHMVSELVGSGYGFLGSVFDSGFYFANEFTFLAPKTVGAVKVGVTDMLDESTVTEQTDAGLGFGNRLTLGARGRNAGLQCQYWTFASDQVTSESWHDYRPIPRFVTSSASALETVDLEITQQHVLFGCLLESRFGGRYAEYDGQDSATVIDQLHDSLELTGVARATRHLRGAGPTLGLSGRKNLRIGFGKHASELLPNMDCDSCGVETCMGDCESWRTAYPCFPLSLYWNGRIAWLWAEESSGAVTEATVNYDGGEGGASTARSRDKALIFDDRDSSIFTLGFQVGLEFTRPVFTRSQLLARVGYEYQHWDLGKNIAESQSFAFLSDGTNFGGRVDALATSNRNYLRLSGFTLSVGLNY